MVGLLSDQPSTWCRPVDSDLGGLPAEISADQAAAVPVPDDDVDLSEEPQDGALGVVASSPAAASAALAGSPIQILSRADRARRSGSCL